MKHNTIPSPAGLILMSLGLCAAVVPLRTTQAAAPPATCAVITHGATQDSAHGVTYENVVVHAPDGSGGLTASKMTLTGGTAEAAHDQADAASLLLMSAITGRHNTACSDWLAQQGKIAAATLKAGGGYDITWTNAVLTHGSSRVNSSKAHFKVDGSTSAHTSAATLALSGMSFQGISNEALLPSSASAAFSLPASELPALMAAIGGRASAAPAVHVTISSFDAVRDTVHLKGNGTATLTGDVNATTASGHLEISNLEALIEKARDARQMKLAAGLVLARLVSHAQNDVNVWNTVWQGGVLTVNGFPLPLH
ncbi:hypothetical protein HK19_03945 [Acetobacter persici]|nr:hypothetical protein HK19_03945 [Acetobacter persici]